jgi:hypothetical protein
MRFRAEIDRERESESERSRTREGSKKQKKERKNDEYRVIVEMKCKKNAETELSCSSGGFSF